MSKFKRTKELKLGTENDVLFVKSTALLATLIIANFVVCFNIIN